MQKITPEQAKTVLNQEIIVASSGNTHTKKAKDLKYNPANAEYTVRYFNNGSEEVKSYGHLWDAVANYNLLDA
jgi:hypothetical protein